MTWYQIKGTLSKLQEGIEHDAPKFGFSASELATQLRFVAFDYVERHVNYRHANTRGEVLEKVGNVPGDLQSDKKGIASPSDATLALVTGQYPAPFLHIQSESEHDFMLPDRLDLVVSAVKQKAAIDFRTKSSGLMQVDRVINGLEIADDTDPGVIRKRLELLAHENPDAFRQAIGEAGANLRKMLQIGEGRGGRSIRISQGFDAPPRWRLINDVLDIIWPRAKGPLKGTKLTAALHIVDQVLYYVHGVKKPKGQSTKSKDGKILAAGDKPKVAVWGAGIDRNLFEYAATLRYQINTLEKAVPHVARRLATLQSRLGNCPDYIATRWLKVWEFGFHPLNNWLEELNRRLRHGDYRPTDDKVRRFTAGVLALPNMPRVDARSAPSLVAARLLRAWHSFERDGKPAAHNKGKKEEKQEQPPGKLKKMRSAKPTGSLTPAQLKKRNKNKMKERLESISPQRI